jgi:hypothetical protein
MRIALAFTAVLAIAAPAYGEVAEDPWAIPPPPDIAALNTAFPTCSLEALNSARKCLTDLEFFRSETLEATYHLGSMRAHVRALKRISDRLENAHASGQIATAEYQKTHDALSDALDAATSADGLYPRTYQNYFDRYKSAVNDAKAAIFRITHQPQ